MENINQHEINNTLYDYSFTQSFQKFSFIKKLITLFLLPLTPIYIIPKGFQLRAWKKKGGEHPPSMLRNVLIMIILYFIFQLPVYVTVAYFYIAFYLSPLVLIIAIYLHKKDFTKDEILHGAKSDQFRVIGFKKLSLTFILLMLCTLFFTFGGSLLLLTVTSMIFILFPSIYKKLYFFPKRFLMLSYSFFNFLNFIPGIYVAGEWFIEKDSEFKVIKSPFQIAKFIISNYEPFFILNVGISALVVRILIWVLYRDKLPESSEILNPSTLSNWGFFSIFLVVPIIMAIYFSWVWDDAEIKVAKAKISSASQDVMKIKETTLLIPVSNSIRRLFTYLFGLSSIIWLVDMASTHGSLTNKLPAGTSGIIVLMIVAFFFTGISTIFMGIMYYRSGVHEFLVNQLRNDIKQAYLEGNDTIKVCYSGIQPVDPNVL